LEGFLDNAGGVLAEGKKYVLVVVLGFLLGRSWWNFVADTVKIPRVILSPTLNRNEEDK